MLISYFEIRFRAEKMASQIFGRLGSNSKATPGKEAVVLIGSFEQADSAFSAIRASDRFQCISKTQSSAKAPAIGRFLERQDLLSSGQKWLACLTPFLKESETQKLRLSASVFFFSEVEYCDNLIFQRRAALDQLGHRLLDANRTIGKPNRITTIFGLRVTRQLQGKPVDRNRRYPSS